MRAQRRKKGQGTLDLSSLIDVIFILLLFVMVSVRFSEPIEKIARNLPESPIEEKGNILGIVVSRTQEGDWFYAGEKVSENTLVQRIEALDSEAGSKTFLLEIDPKSDFGGFFRLTEVLRKKGISKIEIGVKGKN